jgi:deazaflavin-dependent oxidoreductase (nitroreductase family)
LIDTRTVEMQDYSRRTTYRPPARWYRLISNRLGVVLTSLGFAPRDAVTLEVRGRKSGKTRRWPVLTTPHGGEDYLVALAGESDWVRNVRAARGEAVVRRRGARRVHLTEVTPEERPAIIAAYIRHGVERSGAKSGEKQARYFFGLSADPSEEELAAAAEYYPCFRISYLERVESSRDEPGRQ